MRYFRYIALMLLIVGWVAPGWATQSIYLSDNGPTPNQVDRWPITANGNVAPAGIISSSSFQDTTGVAIDAAGNIWVADDTANTVWQFPAGFTGSGAAAHFFVITGVTGYGGLFFDAGGNLWLTGVNAGSTTLILEISAAQLTTLLAGGSSTIVPFRTVTDSTAALGSSSKAITDTSGRIFVTDISNNDVQVYPSTASGATAPTFTITTSPALSAPLDMVFDSGGRLWVTNAAANTAVKLNISGCTTGSCVAPILNTITSSDGTAVAIGIGIDGGGNPWVAFAAGVVPLLTQFTNTGTQLNNISGASTTMVNPSWVALSPASAPTPTATAAPTPTGVCTPNLTVNLLNSAKKIMNGTASAVVGPGAHSGYQAVDTTHFIVDAFTGTASGTTRVSNDIVQIVDGNGKVCSGTSDSAVAGVAQFTIQVCDSNHHIAGCTESGTSASPNLTVQIQDANGFIDETF